MKNRIRPTTMSEEHERAKEPLPVRPPKKHPQGAVVLGRFPASHPRGSWPAEEYAEQRRAEGLNVTVVMNLREDAFFVKEVA